MNAWDVATWISSVALIVTAVVIFGFFLRDAGSILNRDMHVHDDDAGNAPPPGATPDGAQAVPPEDPSP